MAAFVQSAAIVPQHLPIERAHIEKFQAEGLSGNHGADHGVGPEEPVWHLRSHLPHTSHFEGFSSQEEHARLADLMDFSRDAVGSGYESGTRPLLEKIPVEEAALKGFLLLVS